MKRQFRFLGIGVFLFSLALRLGGYTSTPMSTPVQPSISTVGLLATRVPTVGPTPAALSSPTATSRTTAAAIAAAAEAPSTSSAPQPTPSTNTTAVSKDMGLDCHGPFNKLAARTSNYVAPSGEKITPHQYVPHDSKDAKAIPQCSNCHQSHPLPPTASDLATLPKPDVQWCYATCHHKNNLTPCKNCHS